MRSDAQSSMIVKRVVKARGPPAPSLDGQTKPDRISVLLVPGGVMDELPVEILGLLCIELLAAIRALERARHPDTDVYHGAIAGHGPRRDLHLLSRHSCGRAARRQSLRHSSSRSRKLRPKL